MTVPWENWNDMYNEAIDPLAREGAEVRCDVVIIAKGEAASRENTVDPVVALKVGRIANPSTNYRCKTKKPEPDESHHR